jgi:uncharacterized protein
MEMAGEQTIATDQATVWRALNDPEVLKACIPGCESIEQSGDGEYKVKLAAVIGPLRAKFNGKMTLTDLDPPRAYRILFEGQGGPAGFAKGEAAVRLHAEGAATRMAYSVKAQIGGKLAQVGSRLIDGVARKVADEFFAGFSERVAPAVAAAAGPVEGGTPAKPGLWLWVAVAVAVVFVAIGAYVLFAD